MRLHCRCVDTHDLYQPLETIGSCTLSKNTTQLAGFLLKSMFKYKIYEYMNSDNRTEIEFVLNPE